VISYVQTAPLITYYRFSFDTNRINEFTLRELIEKDNRVRWVDFNGPYRQWESGTILVNIQEHEYESFLDSYSEYNLDIRIISDISYLVMVVRFDYNIHDEFVMLARFIEDIRVLSAEFGFYDDSL
jgi:hypothetical protein